MRLLLLILLVFIVIPLSVIIILSPYLALLFGISLPVAMVGWLLDVSFLVAYFSIAWKVYVAFAVFSFAVYTTFAYKERRALGQSCRNYLRHYHGWERFRKDVINALFWPYSWYEFDRIYSGWGITWASVATDAVIYWFGGWRRKENE